MQVSTLNLTNRMGWNIRVSTNNSNGGVLIYAFHLLFCKAYFKSFTNANAGKLWVDMLVAQTKILLNDEDTDNNANA